MNYQRNIRRRSVARRILLSWAVIAVAFFVAGLAAGVLIALAVW